MQFDVLRLLILFFTCVVSERSYMHLCRNKFLNSGRLGVHGVHEMKCSLMFFIFGDLVPLQQTNLKVMN